MATTANESKTLLREMFDALDERDRDAFVATQAEDVVLHHPLETYVGIDDVVAFQWDVFDAFSDETFVVHDVIGGNELVAARYTFAGVHDGEFAGIPPTGETVEMQAMVVMRVDGGAIVETWLQPDLLGLFRQLGVDGAAEP